MTFNQLIDAVVTPYQTSSVVPIHAKETLAFIEDIINTPCCEIAILGDWDVDGIHSAKIVYNDLYTFGVERDNIEVYFGYKKVHGINYEFIRNHLRTYTTHVIIVDSSTNNIEELKILRNMGLKVMVLDHHNPEYTYEEYADICTIENVKFKGNEELFEISAGFLCTLLSNYWRESLGYAKSNDNLIYGYMTLHSDGCLLHDSYIKPIAMYPEKIENKFPEEIELFTTKWTKLNRNFVSYTYCPRINNLCRNNRSDILKLLFFDQISDNTRKLVRDTVEELYQKAKEEKNRLIENYTLFTEDLGSFVFADLDKAMGISSFDWDYLVNATGFIAGAISEQVHKPVISYIDNRDGYYKMSGRDSTDSIDFRDFLKLYNLDGGGHVYAAGFKISIIDFEDFKQQLICSPKSNKEKSYLVWDVRKANPKSLVNILQKLARYNEVAMGKVKPIYLKIHLGSEWGQQQIRKLRKFSLGSLLSIKDLQSKSCNGQDVLVEPDLNEARTLRIVYKEER